MCAVCNLFIDVLDLCPSGGDDLVAVATLEEDDARRFDARLVLVVEEEVLVEREPALAPLSRVGAFFVQVTAEGAVRSRLRRQQLQLAFVNPKGLLHGGGERQTSTND